ncbi:DUF222 domain-containing protein [Geodermatophilus sp. SYSU D00758]
MTRRGAAVERAGRAGRGRVDLGVRPGTAGTAGWAAGRPAPAGRRGRPHRARRRAGRGTGVRRAHDHGRLAARARAPVDPRRRRARARRARAGAPPALAAAHAAGAVSAEAVAVITPITREDELAAARASGVDLDAIDRLLTGVAARLPHTDLVQVVRHYLAGLDPDGTEPDPTAGRRLSWVRHADGSISVRGELDAAGGEKLQAALEAVRQAGRCAGDDRSGVQQQADALVQLCDNQLAAGHLPTLRTVKPHVAVVLDADDLIDPSTGPVPRSWASAPPSPPPGPAGRLVRRPPPARVGPRRGDVPGEQRLAVRAPLAPCVHHGFRVERRPDGHWRTRRPDGTQIRILAPPLTAA